MSLPNSDAAGAGLAPATPGPAGLAPATPGPAGLAPAINGATRAARRVVLVAFAATALLVALFGAERLAFHHQSAATQEQVRQAAAVSERILLEDERLTMSANRAATTGEQRWVQRYDAHIPAIDKAIAEATALAPPDVAQRFDQATRVANDRLVEMERLALERVQGGDLAAARQMLESREYAEQKAVLAAGSSHFLAELQLAVQGRLQALSERSWLLLGLVVLLATAGFALLWRVLVAQLVKAERAFGAQQQEVERLALHDPLTGLANRRWLAMQLAGALARAGREQQRLAVLVLDLDGFKPVNDRLGHAAGDAVLAEVARRLAAQSRQGEIVARLGGDEFVLVLGGHDADDGGEAAVRAAQRLVAQIEQPILTAQGEARISACCGVAVYPADGVDAETLIRRADVALYRAKAQGRGGSTSRRPPHRPGRPRRHSRR
jgi:diguanylate cyclase (GGDEF)-like protein